MLTVVSSYHLSFERFFVVQTGESRKKMCFSRENIALGSFGEMANSLFFSVKLT